MMFSCIYLKALCRKAPTTVLLYSSIWCQGQGPHIRSKMDVLKLGKLLAPGIIADWQALDSGLQGSLSVATGQIN